MKEVNFNGNPASPGLAMGPAFIWQESEIVIPRRTGCISEEEIKHLALAITQAKLELEGIRLTLIAEGLLEEAQVFQAHSLMLDDPTLHQQVQVGLQKGHNIETAWMDAVQLLAEQLASIPDPIFSARAADLRDAAKRVLCLLMGIENRGQLELNCPCIVLARDLCPSETATLDKNKVLALCTVEGSATSHTAILAKSLGIPAVVGVSAGLMNVRPGSTLIIDGDAGTVLVDPNENSLRDYEQKRVAWEAKNATEKDSAQMMAVTLDGHHVEVVANVGNAEDAADALEYGAEGIGLLRTEFLFIGRNSAPTEEEQYHAYTSILKIMEQRPVVIRTLDVGGDKSIPYLDAAEENNPFLGYRAIRMCLQEIDFFKIQLRALLRAGHGHNIRIMFPMIATIDEVLQAKTIVEEVVLELKSKELPFIEKVQIGIMVEIPSVAVMADKFAKIVDFFSIGTNDLTQYTMAVDRTNPRVAHLGDHCHPAVLREIQSVINAAHLSGIWVGVCGEMAGDPEAIPILLGLDLDEFSMAANLIPHGKVIIRSLKLSQAQDLAKKTVNMQSAEQVRAAARELLEKTEK